MNRLEAALVSLVGRLTRLGKDSALVGGLAVSARTEPRLTRDVDLAVAVANDAEAEQIVKELVANGYVAATVVEQESVKRLASVRLFLPKETSRGVVADLLFASSGIEPIVVAEAEPLEVFAATTVRVACVGHLIALKLLARDDRTRPQDAVDLRALRTVLNDEELKRARNAVTLIQDRGFSRGRDLLRLLEEWVAEVPSARRGSK
jgi:predicted nucleotidyltransferase